MDHTVLRANYTMPRLPRLTYTTMESELYVAYWIVPSPTDQPSRSF